MIVVHDTLPDHHGLCRSLRPDRRVQSRNLRLQRRQVRSRGYWRSDEPTSELVAVFRRDGRDHLGDRFERCGEVTAGQGGVAEARDGRGESVGSGVQLLHMQSLAPSLPESRSQELRTSLLLVLANKQDLPAAQGRLTPAQVSEAFGLTDLREREWQIMGCSALTGLGLFEGMDWLVGKLAAR